MTSPPPPAGGSNDLVGALNGIAQQLQALLHQQQTFANLPSSARQARQARQGLQTPAGDPGSDPEAPGGGAPPAASPGQRQRQPWGPAALLGGNVPQPGVPTRDWFHTAAQQAVRQVVLNQPRRGTAPAPSGPSPQAPYTPAGLGGSQWPPMNQWGPMGIPGMPGQWGPTGMPGMMPGMPMGPGGTPVVMPTQGGSGGGHGGGSWGASTGLGGWTRSNLPIMGARFGPWGAVAGAALSAATQIPEEIRSQRDKNAFYQSVEGGSNFAGFGERLKEETYRWTTPMMFSSDEARRAFKGVTKLGYNSKIEGGPGRQDALDFVYHGKSAYGATVDESLQELQAASKNAQVNFKDLSNALKDVSDSAGKAGINAQQARAEMTQLMDQATKSGYGSSATDVARMEQKTKLGYGRSFQDVDVSGRLSSSHAYMASSLAGISVSEYLTGGAKTKGAADAKLDKATMGAVLKPGVEEWIKEQIGKSGGNVSESVATQIGEDMLQRFYANDPFALSQVVASLSGQTGLAEDPVKAATWIVQQHNGKGAGAAVKEMSKEDKAAAKKTSKKNSISTGVGEGMRIAGTDRGPNAGKNAMGSRLDEERSGGFLGIGSHASGAVQAYNAWHKKKGGQEDPVIWNLLNAIEGDEKSKVAVSTKGGKRVVSLEDAVKRHRNELASGKAVIMEGDKAGKTVAEVLGKDKVDPLRDFSKEKSRKETAGQSYASWEKDHTKKGKGGERKLQIGLTAEARRLLTVVDSTGTKGSAATANPPLSPYPANPSYKD